MSRTIKNIKCYVWTFKFHSFIRFLVGSNHCPVNYWSCSTDIRRICCFGRHAWKRKLKITKFDLSQYLWIPPQKNIPRQLMNFYSQYLTSKGFCDPVHWVNSICYQFFGFCNDIRWSCYFNSNFTIVILFSCYLKRLIIASLESFI